VLALCKEIVIESEDRESKALENVFGPKGQGNFVFVYIIKAYRGVDIITPTRS
jgi:hypothetical protein